MSQDSITDEIRAIRHQLAEQFGNSVAAVLADARKREASDGRAYVTLPKRQVLTGVPQQLGTVDQPTKRLDERSSTPAAG